MNLTEAIAKTHEAIEGRYDLTGEDLYFIHGFLCDHQVLNRNPDFHYNSKAINFRIDMRIFIDTNRELNSNDHESICINAEKIVKSIHEESINLDPKQKEYALKIKKEIIGLFGNKQIYVEEIPNGYCSEYCCKHLPWFLVTTKKGRIKIGWRKRVIHIDWNDSIISEFAESLFPEEDTTKFEKTIHAWGLDKATHYINVLLSK